MIFGIDPGLSGAVALLNPLTWELTVHDMPTLPNKQGRSETDMHALAEILAPQSDTPHVAIVEKVGPMPKQGVSSVWRFAENYGAIRLAVAGHRLETHYVTPQSWKKHYGLSRDKGNSLALVKNQFPNYVDLFKRKKDDGRAEATLLALYGLRTLPQFAQKQTQENQ